MNCKMCCTILIVSNVFIFHCKKVTAGFDTNAFVMSDDDIFGQEFDGDYKYQNCGGKKRTVYLKEFKARPKQFQIPQNISLSVTLKILEDILSPISISLTISKRLPFIGYTKLPCISSYGSCTFHDICNILDKYPEGSEVCPKWLKEAGLDCKCPFARGEYKARDIFIALKTSSVPKWIASGDYKIVTMITSNKSSFGCFKFRFRIK